MRHSGNVMVLTDKSILQLLWRFKNCFYFRHHKIDCDLIFPAFRDDKIRVSLCRFDELVVHRADDRQVLVDDRSDGAAALFDIPADTADDPEIRVRIDKEFDIHQRSEEHTSELQSRENLV